MEGGNTAPWVRGHDTAWDVHAICLHKLTASSPHALQPWRCRPTGHLYLQNNGIHLKDDTVSQPTKHKSEYTQYRKCEIYTENLRVLGRHLQIQEVI